MSKMGFWSSERPPTAASQSLSEFSTSLSNYASTPSTYSNNCNQYFGNGGGGNSGTSDFGNSRSFSAPAGGLFSNNNYNQNNLGGGEGGLQYSNTNNQNRGFSNENLSNNNFGYNNSKAQALSNGANQFFTSTYITNKNKSFDGSNSKLFGRRNFNSNQNDGNNTHNNTQPQNYVPIQQFRQYYNNREQRKNSSSGNRDAPPSLFMGKDGSYPMDLNNLMNPFFCALCNARLNSIKSANIHYESKIHDRHITNWLKRTYTDRGIEAPELKRFVTEITVETPSAYRCDLCSLDLSSPQHALQHYNGKRHRNAATKVSPITGIGYFNVEGKWIKTGKVIDKKTGKETSYILVKTPSGNEPVVLYAAPDVAPTTKKADSDEPPAKKPHIETPAGAKTSNGKDSNNQLKAATATAPKKAQANNTTNRQTTTVNNQYQSFSLDQKESPLQTPQEALQAMNCTVCNVSTTSRDQMLLHLKGARHTKKLKALGENPITALFDTPAGTILESLNSNDPTDISMYRTPSGSYYCKPCNAAMQEMAHMKRHISSKKHLATLRGSQAAVGGN